MTDYICSGCGRPTDQVAETAANEYSEQIWKCPFCQAWTRLLTEPKSSPEQVVIDFSEIDLHPGFRFACPKCDCSNFAPIDDLHKVAKITAVCYNCEAEYRFDMEAGEATII